MSRQCISALCARSMPARLLARPPAAPLSLPLRLWQVAGGRTMRMRTNDPAYLDHVERWWAVLFSKLRRYLHENGGPILMVQASGRREGGGMEGGGD